MATEAFASSDYRLRLGQRLVQLAGVFAAAAGVVRLAAAFAADHGGDLLNDFARLNFRGEIGRNRGDEGHGVISDAAEYDHPFESALQRVRDGLQEITVRVAEVVDDQGNSCKPSRTR